MASGLKKVALVTGAARGIGLAAATRFLDDGWHVAMLDILGDTLRSTVNDLGRADAALALEVDVSDPAAIEAAVEQVRRQFGRIDALVNNAGNAVFKPMLDVTLEEWQRVLAVNLTGPFLMTQAVAPIMQAQKSGSIITTASIGGYRAGGSSHAYVTAKAAVLHLTHSVAAELGEDNVRVNSISPGAIVTGIFGKGAGLDHDVADRELAVLAGRLAKAQPIPRAGVPDDIARAALFLASDASSFINGADIVVDGGNIAGKPFSQGVAGRREMTEAIAKAAQG